MADKLARVGLLPKRAAQESVTLGEQLARYISKRTDVKPSTAQRWRHTQRCLLAFFGTDRLLASITAGDARDWERWLKTGDAREHRYAESTADDGLALNTVRKRVGDAKQFFEDAVQRELLTRNPFAGLKGTVGSNRSRDYFLTREDTTKIIEACPDAQWRLIVALARYGGVRTPSEMLSIRLQDVDWERERSRVESPKTEHHEGKECRVIPIFPELRPYLEAVWEDAEPGTEFLITRYRSVEQNLRTTFQKIIRRAGLKPWPKPFQNLRSSRATELANEYPAHVAAAWLGHSTVVASKHYWQVTEADYERAVERGAEGGAQAAQKEAQHTSAEIGRKSQRPSKLLTSQQPLRFSAEPDKALQSCLVAEAGLEPARPVRDPGF